MREGPKFYGVYRGTVVNNVDPLQIGRIQATVPDVSGLTPTTWATPCITGAGKQMGTFFVPQIGYGVWLQFQSRDPDRPVATGSWRGCIAAIPGYAPTGV